MMVTRSRTASIIAEGIVDRFEPARLISKLTVDASLDKKWSNLRLDTPVKAV
jgi:hypothetical protein